MADDGLKKWDYAMVEVGFVEWERIDKPKDRAKWRLDSETDWEKLREEHARGIGVFRMGRWRTDGVWLARDPADGRFRPPLAVLQDLGQNGWEVVGVQTTGLDTSEWDSWYHSSFLLKRPLPVGTD